MLCVVADAALVEHGHFIDVSSAELQLGNAGDALLGGRFGRWRGCGHG